MMNHSGGAEGSDTAWETEGARYGIPTIAYSFEGHKCLSRNRYILTAKELEEGWRHVEIANNTLHRSLWKLPVYIRNLLSRNWFQVKTAEAIYAVGVFEKKNETVNVGTGWAVQMAIDDGGKSIYVLEQTTGDWHQYNPVAMCLQRMDNIPELTEHFAGIGTRKLNEVGRQAISHVLSINLGILAD